MEQQILELKREIDKFTLKAGDFVIPYAVLDQLAVYYEYSLSEQHYQSI